MAAQRVRDAPTATLRAAWGAVTAAAAWTSAVGLLPAVDAVERSVMTVAANVGGMVRHGMVAPLSRGALRGFCVQLTTGAADATASTVRRTRLPDLLAFHALDRYTAMTAGEMWAKFGLSAPFMDAVHLPFARAAYARGVAAATVATVAAAAAAAAAPPPRRRRYRGRRPAVSVAASDAPAAASCRWAPTVARACPPPRPPSLRPPLPSP